MTISFENQVAIVTGAGRGLGREYALEIARRGGAVIVVDIGRDAESGVSWGALVVKQIAAEGGRAVAIDESVASAAGGRSIAEAAMTHFGRIDAVIHNAGFLRPAFFAELSDAAVKDVLDVHLMGAFNVGRPAWAHMQRQNYGRMVLTSSSAIFGYHASANYVAAKAALLGLTTALAHEGEVNNILVNAILPFAKTDIGKDNPVPGSSMASLKSGLEASGSRWQSHKGVSSLVTYLASSSCSASGRAYSAALGRFARVGMAVFDGWLAPSAEPSAEDIRAHFSEVESLDTSFLPSSMLDEVNSVLNRLA